MTREERAPILEVRDLVVRYGMMVAVDRASLDAVDRGLAVLVGPSGCGKTSLLRAIAGFEVPVQGSVRIDGQTVAGPGCWVPPERRAVGMVFQQGALFPHMSVWQNVAYGVEHRADAEARTRAALELVDLAGLGKRHPDQLSGGEQQRVALARALAPSPRIVLLDEPFANLDADLRQRLREEVCTILKRSGTTAVMVTHDQEEALSIADRLAVMERGRILQVGRPEEIYRAPRSATVADFIGNGQLVPCTVEAGRLQCALGPAASDAPDGPGLLLVRAEDLVLVPAAGSGGGARGTIARRRYFGHDQLDEVALEAGSPVRVRDRCSGTFAPGDPVRVLLAPKRYPVFAASGARETIGHATVTGSP